MRGPLLVEDLDEAADLRRPVDQLRRAVGTLVGWAEEVHPDDEVSPAEILTRAADLLLNIDDPDGAVALCRLAVSAEGEGAAPDTRVYLHEALLAAARVDEARQLADVVRRERPVDLDVYAFLGENWEAHGDLGQAHRWYTLGLAKDVADELDGRARVGPGLFSAFALVQSRRRVRAELGLPPDDLT